MERKTLNTAASIAVALVAISSMRWAKPRGAMSFLNARRGLGEVDTTFNSTKQITIGPLRVHLFNIVWLHPSFAITQWLTLEENKTGGFESCKFKNCINVYSYNASEATRGDAVIFPGRQVGPTFTFKRPSGQVWIFFELESPEIMNSFGGHWRRKPWKSQFNWTMAYDTPHSDISFKYGEIRLKSTRPDRNYTAIALNKTDDVLIVSSHCKTPSKRESYIAELGKHIDVEVLGGCGVKWSCGRRFVHDDCFKILNKYRYYLAFENSLCNKYFTEKLFNNFDYDTVLITRGGGNKGEVKNILPEGTFISTDDFDSAKSLADHLKNLTSSVTDYAEILKRKDRYHNAGYATMYKEAMCDICKRMNRQDEYRQTIPDIREHWFSKKPCRKPGDIG